MDVTELGQIVTDYLRDRDDIAEAVILKQIVATDASAVVIAVETQGGGGFGIVISAGVADA